MLYESSMCFFHSQDLDARDKKREKVFLVFQIIRVGKCLHCIFRGLDTLGGEATILGKFLPCLLLGLLKGEKNGSLGRKFFPLRVDFKHLQRGLVHRKRYRKSQKSRYAKMVTKAARYVHST